MQGGYGYTPKQAGDLTIDQILMLMTDRKILAGNRRNTRSPLVMVASVENNLLSGRDTKGNPIKRMVKGISKARQLMEAANTRRLAEKTKKPPKREIKNTRRGK